MFDDQKAFVHPLQAKSILFDSSSQMEQVIHISSRTAFHIYQRYLRICPPRPAGGDSTQHFGW
jgi:hypothetical protein